MEPESPDNERQRKIDEAIESGNHELREMARLAYNRGDKDLARNIWRSLTESQDQESKSSDSEDLQSGEVPAAVTADPDLEAARKAEIASQQALSVSAPTVYVSSDAPESGVSNPSADAGTVSSDAMTGTDSVQGAEVINPAMPGTDLT